MRQKWLFKKGRCKMQSILQQPLSLPDKHSRRSIYFFFDTFGMMMQSTISTTAAISATITGQ